MIKVIAITLCFITILYFNYLEKKKKLRYKNDESFQMMFLRRDRILLRIYESLIILSIAVYVVITLQGFHRDMSITINSNNVVLPFVVFITLRMVIGYFLSIYFEKKR